jgi:hypothetical protein
VKRYPVIFLTLLALIPCTTFLAQNAAAPSRNEEIATAHPHCYHPHPPTGRVAAILDPTQFQDDRAAFVAYSLARRIPSVLYQIPCYCPCDEEQGHQSLLDCFTSLHGQRCGACRAEVIFCFVKTRKGKTPEDIRTGVAAGDAWKIRIGKYTDKALANRKNFDHLQTRVSLGSK